MPRINIIPGLRIGSKKDLLTKSDTSVKINAQEIKKGSRKEETGGGGLFEKGRDPRGAQIAERCVRLNQLGKTPPPTPTPTPISSSDYQKTIGTYLLLGSFLLGIMAGRWSSKINLTIGE